MDLSFADVHRSFVDAPIGVGFGFSRVGLGQKTRKRGDARILLAVADAVAKVDEQPCGWMLKFPLNHPSIISN